VVVAISPEQHEAVVSTAQGDAREVGREEQFFESELWNEERCFVY